MEAVEQQPDIPQPSEELALLDAPDVRPLYKKKKKELGVAGAVLALVVGIIVYVMLTGSTGGTNPVAVAALTTQQPETPAPAPAPMVPIEMAPALQEQYQYYRFVHFLHEMEACQQIANGRRGRDVEARALGDLGGAVRELLAAYDSGKCEERTEFAVHPERGKWLRHWATQLREGSAE